MKYSFPRNFLWGSAVWATGVEAAAFIDGKAPTVWDEHYRIDPDRFYNGVGPDQTVDFYHNYETMAQLAKDINHNSFRTSISWARLIPDGKTVNEKAVEFYRNEFKAFKQKGIFLNVTLYWFDMPLMYEKIGGFSNRDVIEHFVYYCEKCFELFDEYVDGWFIYNEPIMDILFKYQMKVCYPCETDLNKAFNSVYNMSVAHAMVVKKYKEKYKKRIGSVLNQTIVYARSDDKDDLYAKKMYEVINYEAFEYPLLKGEISEDWLKLVKDCGVELDIRQEDLELIKENTIHYLGINNYFPARVMKQEEKDIPMNLTFNKSPFFAHYVWPERRFNKDRGWEIYPQAIYDLLMRNKKEYNNIEMIITENGIGIQNEERYIKDGIINDDYRIEYIRDYLIKVNEAINDGANVIGYNVWSFIDLWSPTNQFKNCYGLYSFNPDTKEIKKKKSADWFKEVSKNNGF